MANHHNLSKRRSKQMKRSNTQALFHLILPCLLLATMLVTLNKATAYYICGQIAGGIFFAQAFILLHEFGHRSLFRTSSLNMILGHLCSFLVFIPYRNWREIHALHHKWTGFRDKDPTTEKTFSERLSKKQEWLISVSWKYYLPLFTLGYRFGIYWKAEKLKRHLSYKCYKKCVREMILYGLFYLISVVVFPFFWLSIFPALYLSFVLCDLLSLSQHSHIQMQHSQGKPVSPLPYFEQMNYSRSLIFPRWISKFFLFNFNYHELHHAYPGLACYHLDKIAIKTPNQYPFLPWLKKVKSMNGVDFIFRSNAKRDGF